MAEALSAYLNHVLLGVAVGRSGLGFGRVNDEGHADYMHEHLGPCRGWFGWHAMPWQACACLV